MNNIKTDNMKKLFFALLACSLVFVSCKSSGGSVKDGNDMENVGRRPMGVWKAMEWTSNDKIEVDKSVVKVEVPAAKNTVELTCNNYNRFWISSVSKKGVAENEKFAYKGEYYSVRCDGNKLYVTFEANTAAERTVDIQIQAGDIFSRLQSNQKAAE